MSKKHKKVCTIKGLLFLLLQLLDVFLVQKGPPLPLTRFSHVTPTNVWISPQNFLTFSFKPFATLMQIYSSYLVSVPNYWTWTKTTPQKKWFIWSNGYKLEVMINSLIEMLELPNFSQVTTSTIWFKSGDKVLLVTSFTELITS